MSKQNFHRKPNNGERVDHSVGGKQKPSNIRPSTPPPPQKVSPPPQKTNSPEKENG